MNRRRLIGAVTATPLLAGVGLAGVAFAATHRAQHLVITEVMFDPNDQNSGDGNGFAEYIEIHNPTGSPIALNEGAIPGTVNNKAAYFLSDSSFSNGVQYWNVVNSSTLALGGSADFIVEFPLGSVIPPHGTVVVTDDSDAFLAEFFGGNLARFRGQPGAPQLMEFTQDTDTVANMLIRHGGAVRLNLTNGGENVVLFNWDGASDLVRDVDIVQYGTPSGTNVGPSRTTSVTLDGPDAGTVTTAFAADTPAYATYSTSSAGGLIAISRRSIIEKNEGDTGGNGLSGNDETSEVTTPVATPTSSADAWFAVPTAARLTLSSPGTQAFALDSYGGDALSWLAPVAVSAADGPNGTASPLDWGADGTLTEMYVTSLDTDRDGNNEAIYVAIRGDMFGEPDTNDTNVEILLIDGNPYTTTPNGVRRIISAGSDLNDVDRTIDAVLTRASVQMGSTVPATASWDTAVVFDKLADGATNQDVLTWHPAAGGSPTGFVTVPTSLRPRFDGAVDAALYPAAPGTSHPGADLYEVGIPLGTPTSGMTHLGLTAITVAGDGLNASPNTLPEGAFDTMGPAVVTIDRFVCWDIAASAAVVYYDDVDGDGHGDPGAQSAYCGPSKAGVATVGDDCDDDDDLVAPGKSEICNSIDDDCDALVDAADPGAVLTTYYADGDVDTFGDPLVTKSACTAPSGYVADDQDCDDGDALVNPSASEVCNGVDDDCDTLPDDGIPTTTWYLDSDNDTFGGATSSVACAAPTGYIAVTGDCLDTDPLVNPGVTEVCNTKDDDCDTDVDEGVQTTYYRDADVDTFGDELLTQAACDVAPVGYVADRTDCDDAAFAVNPGATEVCNKLDDDCDTSTDDTDSSVTGQSTYYTDGDGDTYGDPLTSVEVCFPLATQVPDSADCDDTDAAVNPTAVEVCNAIDDDCDDLLDDADVFTGGGLYSVDTDGDGFGDDSTPPAHKCTMPAGSVDNDADCDDLDEDVNPIASEICNLVDDDCDLGVDDADPEGAIGTFWYPDVDTDGHGSDTATGVEQCDPPGLAFADVGDDCDDTAVAINPDELEICNSKDDDCDGQIDAGDPSVTGATLWFVDVDKDGFGDLLDDGTLYCADPTGHQLTATDCEDADKTVYPGAPELADLQDNDCDGHDETYDADGDGLDVLGEIAAKTDPDLADTDDDGLDDGDEVAEGTNPLVQDTDLDGVFDGDEVLDGTDPLVKDSDGDGLEDGAEATAGSDPLLTDTDEDGVDDGDEVADGTSPVLADTDGDGVDDGLEGRDGTDPLDKTDLHDDAYDGDNDGLPDHEEYALETDATKADTDGGGVNDGDEVDAGTDPLDGADDEVPDTDPPDTDTDTGPIDTGEPPPDKKCGCASGGQAPWWALGLALISARRPRTVRRPR